MISRILSAFRLSCPSNSGFLLRVGGRQNRPSNRVRARLLQTLFLLFSVASPAYADTGVPMLFITMPAMLIALLPVIGIESYVLSKRLRLPAGRSFKTASIINVLSTFLGIPITWLLLVIVELITGGGYAYGIETPLQRILAVTWQAAWLVPYRSELHWMVPASACVLLVPFFFASWFIEYKVAKQMLQDIVPRTIKQAIFIANLSTYSLLGLIALVFLFMAEP